MKPYFEFLPIELEKYWSEIFAVIEENFRRVILKLYSQAVLYRIEQFEGDDLPTDDPCKFPLSYTIDNNTSLIVFRNDDLIGMGFASNSYYIEDNILYLKTPLDEDEGLTIRYFESNFFEGVADLYLQYIENIFKNWDLRFDNINQLVDLIDNYRDFLVGEENHLLDLIGRKNISYFDSGTVTGCINELISLHVKGTEGTGTHITDKYKEELTKRKDWYPATDEEVLKLMEDILDVHAHESLEDMEKAAERIKGYKIDILADKQEVSALKDQISKNALEILNLYNLAIKHEQDAHKSATDAEGLASKAEENYNKSLDPANLPTSLNTVEGKVCISNVYSPKPNNRDYLLYDKETDTWLSVKRHPVSRRAENSIVETDTGLYIPDPGADLQPKETGKGLSDKDFTSYHKKKLDGIEAGANPNSVEALSVNGSIFIPSVSTKTTDITLSNITDKWMDTSSYNILSNAAFVAARNKVTDSLVSFLNSLGTIEFKYENGKCYRRSKEIPDWVEFQDGKERYEYGYNLSGRVREPAEQKFIPPSISRSIKYHYHNSSCYRTHYWWEIISYREGEKPCGAHGGVSISEWMFTCPNCGGNVNCWTDEVNQINWWTCDNMIPYKEPISNYGDGWELPPVYDYYWTTQDLYCDLEEGKTIEEITIYTT